MSMAKIGKTIIPKTPAKTRQAPIPPIDAMHPIAIPVAILITLHFEFEGTNVYKLSPCTSKRYFKNLTIKLEELKRLIS